MNTRDLIEQSTYVSIRSGELWIEECKAIDIAAEFGTPLFVISETELRTTYRRIHKAFESRWSAGSVEILPSFKACPVIGVRKILSEEGAGCDVFGEAEFEGALLGNCDPKLISLNGSIKGKEIIARAISCGARVVLDAPRELDLCIEEATRQQKLAHVSFRAKPYLDGLELSSDFNGRLIRDYTQLIKYGMPYNELVETGRRAFQSPVIAADGMHCHIGRHSSDPRMWKCLVESCVKLIADVSQHWGGWTPRVINFGGGFPEPRNFATHVQYNRQQDVPDIDCYAEVVTNSFREALEACGLSSSGIVLQLEPGRSLHAGTGVHLMKIVNIKQSSSEPFVNWIETDSSMFFLDSGLSTEGEPKFRFTIANRPAEQETSLADIVGRSCGFERLLAQVPVPDVQVGEIVVLLDTGAYHETESRNFNAMPRPGSVLVCGSRSKLAKRAETVFDVYSRDVY